MKTYILAKFAFAFLLTSVLVSCKKDELPTSKEPEVIKEQPAPNKPTVPSSPVDAIPPTSDSLSIPTPPTAPQPPTVPQSPAIPGLLRKVSWAPLDYKLFEYNSQQLLVKYISQYNNVQGTNNVRRDEFTYTYNSAGQLAEVVNNLGARTVYIYNGEVWGEALSYDLLNRPLKKYQFKFNDKKQLIEYCTFKIDLANNSTPESKVTLQYDQNENLVRWKESYYNTTTGEFGLSVDLAFSNFDNKKFAKNSLSFSYVLQPLNFWVNNPGRKEFIGNASPIENYSYTYDAYGYPSSKTTSYIYDRPLPTLKAEFTY